MKPSKNKITLLEILQIIPFILIVFITGFVSVITFTTILWLLLNFILPSL